MPAQADKTQPVTLPPLSAQARELLGRFESLWQQGQRPQPLEFAAACPENERLRVLADLVHAELEFRLQAGEDARADDYLGRYPELRTQGDIVTALIVSEFRLRGRLGGADPADFLRRFPAQAALIEQLAAEEAAPTAVPTLDFPGRPTGGGTLATAHPLPAVAAPDGAGLPTLAAPNAGAPTQKMPTVPTLPGYEILGELGRGGMGVVYKARHLRLNRVVAVKMVLAGAHAGADELARFRGEAEAVALLKHPNVVQVYDVGEVRGLPFLALEYLEGGSLEQKLSGTPLPPDQAAGLVETLAHAMAAAHAAGLVHRDLKPANVLLAADGTPKVTDFGLAKKLETDPPSAENRPGSHLTATGAVLGTPSYAAPEQAAGKTKDVGPACDIYALGATLYHCLTGRPPFRAATVMDTLFLVLHEEPVPPRRLQPSVPRDLETVCLKCLQKEPGKRYASAAALADELRRCLNGEPVVARRAGVVERGMKYARRKPWVVGAWAAGLAAVLFLLAGGGYYLYRQNLDLKAELSHQNALAEKRERAATGVSRAEDALGRQDWPGAVAAANETLALVGDDPALAGARGRAGHLRDAARRALQLTEYHDQAMSHAVLAAEQGDQASHREASLRAARSGLALFALVGPDGAARQPPTEGDFPAEVKDAVRSDCYELLLTAAEVLLSVPDGTPEERRARADEALRLFDQAARLDLNTRAWHERRAALLRSLGDAPGAKMEDESAAAVEPSLAVDHFLLGLSDYRSGALARARTHLGRVLEGQPNHFWANYCLAGCYLRTPSMEVRAMAPLTACLQINPKFVGTYLLRGLVNGEVGEFEAAYADFRAAEPLADADLARYSLWVNRAFVRMRQGADHDSRHEAEQAAACYDQAEAELVRATDLRPQQPQAYLNLADVRLRRGRWRDALPPLDRAIALAPSAALYRKRATLHEQGGALADALPDLEEAIKRARAAGRLREVADDQLQRGRILFRLEKYADALAAFDQAAAVAPGLAVAHELRGEALLELRRTPEAAAAFDLYLTRGPGTAVAFRARGLCRARLNDYAGAIDDYSRALELERVAGQPPDPVTLAHRGWAYVIQQAPRLAIRDFDEALRLRGKNAAECHAGLGSAHVQLGQWREAVGDAAAALGAEKPAKRTTLYNVARIYAQAVPLARPDGAGEAPGGQYERAAVFYLRRACDMTPAPERADFWKEYVEDDAALRSIRGNEEFLRLRREIMGLGK